MKLINSADAKKIKKLMKEFRGLTEEEAMEIYKLFKERNNGKM